MIFIPNDKSAKVLKPCEEAFDLPASPVATQRTAILGDGFAPIAFVRSNHLHASFFGQTSIQWAISSFNFRGPASLERRAAQPARRC